VKLTTIEPEFVEFVPAELAPGTLYLSMAYATTVHLCACGCGNKVVLPLSPAQWHLLFDGEAVSLTPSVGNWEFPCRSHYWIKNNKIRWAAQWSKEQVARARRQDAADLDAYFMTKQTSEPQPSRPVGSSERPVTRFLRGLLRRIGH
jgi:hypothetical protein